MKSQKQNNHKPRPFKNQFSDRGRSGGKDLGFIPGGKPVIKIAKKKTATEVDADTTNTNDDTLTEAK